MKGRRKEIKNKNQGFTLVELMIAVVILAIIVAPLSRSFITAARTNGKAKRVMEATSAGQNLLEVKKVASFASLVQEIPVDASNPTAESEVILSKTGIVDDAGNAILDENGNPYYKYVKKISHGYLDTNGHSYQAIVTIDPTNYLDKQSLSKDNVKTTQKYNSIPLAQLGTMNSVSSAVYVMDSGEDLDAIMTMYPEGYESEDTDVKDAFLDSISRGITFFLEKDGDYTVTKVSMSYFYNDIDGNPCEYTPFVKHEIYRNKGDNLQNVYILFTPLYYATGKASTAKETITVQNAIDAQTKAYLVKQDLGTNALDGTYAMKFQLAEKDHDDSVKATMSVLTNMTFGSNLSFTYKNGVNEYSDAAALNRVNTGDLRDEKSNTVIYDLEVKVYRDDEIDQPGAEPLVVLTGTTTR